MQFPSHPRASNELRESMDAYGLTPALQDQFTRCISFHTVTAPGLFIGVFMVDYVLELVGARHGESSTRSQRRTNISRILSRLLPDARLEITACRWSPSANLP